MYWAFQFFPNLLASHKVWLLSIQQNDVSSYDLELLMPCPECLPKVETIFP